MNVPFVDLSVIHKPLAAEFQAVLDRAVTDSAFIGGKVVADFERAWADYCGAAHCVAVSSGTDALVLALKAEGIGKGDEVITVPNSFVATAEAIVMAGARPVFADVDPRTHLMRDWYYIPSKFSAVFLPVHLFGQPCPLVETLDYADKFGMRVIEDACQSHGARYADGRRVGGWGENGIRAACWSFYPGKNLGALGDAGAVTTDDPALAETIRWLRDHGSPIKGVHTDVGGTHRMDAIQAGFLLAKLPHLDIWNACRRAAAARYTDRLKNIPGVETVTQAPDTQSCWHLYVIRVPNRDHVARGLAARGIQTGVHYPEPIHLQPGWRWLGYGPGSFPVAESLARCQLSLPMFAGIADAQVDAVCAALAEVMDLEAKKEPADGQA